MANSRLSLSICRTTRALPAPSAMRTAISRSRAAARASRRFARLAQAISSTSSTAPLNTASAGRRSPVRRRCSGAARIRIPSRKPAFSKSFGYSARMLAVSCGNCAWSCPSVSVGCTLASMFTSRMGRVAERGRCDPSSIGNGRQIWVPLG